MPDLIRDFRREGADVVVYITESGLRYVAKEALEWCSQNPVIDHFTADAEHLSDSTIFDVFVVAPASYNTLNNAALGVANSVVSAAIAAALGRMENQGIPILFAPTMHGAMHNSILTRSMKILREMGATLIPPLQTHGKNNLPSLFSYEVVTKDSKNYIVEKNENTKADGKVFTRKTAWHPK